MSGIAMSTSSMAAQRPWYRRAGPLALTIAVLGAGGIVYGVPYWTVLQMQKAVSEGDAATFSSYVDYPALRDSVRKEVRAQMLGVLPAGDEAREFAAQVIDPVVNRLLTPEAVTQLVSAVGFGTRAGTAASGNSGHDEPAQASPVVEVRQSYQSWSRFAVEIGYPGAADPLRMTLSRRGLEWRLTGIVLPLK